MIWRHRSLAWVLSIPLLVAIFWFASVAESAIAQVLVMRTSAHGLSLADYTSGSVHVGRGRLN